MQELDPQELAEAIRVAREAWSGVELPPAAFAQWLSERLRPGQAVGTLRTSDLYLACGCAAGDQRALRYFEEEILSTVDAALRRLGISGETIDETKQLLRRRLFIGEDGAPPRITDYSGRGELRSWVRVVAVRAALRSHRRPKGQVDVDSSVIRAVASPRGDLELDYLKRHYAAEFERALRDALAQLTARDRNVLRYYYAERLSIDAIGTVYRTHRATAARWVRRAVDALVDSTRRLMTARLSASGSDVSSIMRLIQSELEPALRAVLLEAPPRDSSDGSET